VLVRDVMRPVLEVRPEDPATALVPAFRDPEARAVAVVTDLGELVGTVTEEHMLGILLPSYVIEDEALAGVLEEEAGARLSERLERRRVKDLVDATSRERLRVAPDDTLIEVAVVLARSGAPAVLVTAGRRVLGVVTIDVLLPALLG